MENNMKFTNEEIKLGINMIIGVMFLTIAYLSVLIVYKPKDILVDAKVIKHQPLPMSPLEKNG